MTKQSQEAIAKDVMGVRRFTFFTKLMDNFSEAERARRSMIESSGMALHDNTQEMDTLLKKTQLLGAEWQKFTAAIGKAGALEDLKSFADNIKPSRRRLQSSSYIYSPLKIDRHASWFMLFSM